MKMFESHRNKSFSKTMAVNIRLLQTTKRGKNMEHNYNGSGLHTTEIYIWISIKLHTFIDISYLFDFIIKSYKLFSEELIVLTNTPSNNVNEGEENVFDLLPDQDLQQNFMEISWVVFA